MKKTFLKMGTYITVSIFFLSLLSGCGTEVIQKTQKKDFFVQIQDIEDFSKTFIIKKTGKLVGEQEITISSKVNGQIQQIFVENGDIISKGQNLLNIKDTIANYNLIVEQSKVALKNAKVQYEQTKINLQKNIDDIKISLENARNALKVAIAMSNQNLKKAKQDYENASLSGESISSLNTQTTISDIKTMVDNLKQQFGPQQDNLENFIKDVVYFADKLFGVTKKYKIYNDKFEIYLSAKDSSLKNTIEREIYLMYANLAKIKKIKTDGLSDEELLKYIDDIEKYYNNIFILLNDIHSALTSSVSSNTFPQSMIDGYIAKVDGYQAKYQQFDSVFVGYKNQVYSLLKKGNIDNDTLIEQKIKLLQKQAENQQRNADILLKTTKINIENNIFNAKQKIKNLEIALDTAQKTYDTQLSLLKNQIDNARINYQKALTQASKLYVKSPINGVVSQILVDRGQDVGPGTLLFKLSSNNDPIVEVGLNKKEYKRMKNIEKIFVQVDDKLVTGHLLSLSRTANNNGLYTAKVFLEDSSFLLGDVVDVFFYINYSNYLLPLDIVKPISDNRVLINILQNNKDGTGNNFYIQPTIVNVGYVWGNDIELKDKLETGTNIILSDVENFDENLNILKIK